MKVIKYTDVQATHFGRAEVKGVAARVIIGRNDGATNFCMRVFAISPGGHTPRHGHAWEHEMFVHAGAGEIYGNGRWNPVQPGTALFVPPDEEHQIRNTGQEPLIIVCLVPSSAPEL